MIRKTKFHKAIALLCAIVCLSTSLVFPTSAASDISVISDIAEADIRAWFPANSTGKSLSGNDYVAITKSIYTIELLDDGWYSLTLSDTLLNSRSEYGVSSHQWYALLFDICYDESLKDLDFSNYRLDFYFELQTDTATLINDNQFAYEDYEDVIINYMSKPLMGLDYSIVNEVGGAVPRLGHLNAYDNSIVASINLYSNTNLYQKYSITDTDDIEALFANEYITFGFPFNTLYYGNDLKFSIDMTLVYTGTSTDETPDDTTAPDVTDEPDEPNTDVPALPSDNFGFAEPESYAYDSRFYFTPSKHGQITSGYSVTDFYLKNNSMRFNDTTNSIFTVSWPWDGYSLYYSFTYADGYSATDFTDTIFRTYSIDLETQVSTDLVYTGADLSKYAFRLHFYIDVGDSSDFDFFEFRDYVENASDWFYGFEPFSLTAGSVVIPFEYWELEFNATHNCIRATLELDGKNAIHQNFMRVLASNQQDVNISFTLGNDTTFLFGTGENSNGFWKKYSDDDSSATPDDSTTTGGFSQDDIDSAFNKGYNKGVADNGGTNYVFAFVNGLWTGFGNFYSLVANGISIGGISLNAIITSIIIIAVLLSLLRR